MKENKNQKNTAVNQITEGVIWKQLLFFFFPILFGTLFQQIYNTADTVVVGRFVGKEALAAVGGSSSMIVNLIVGILLYKKNVFCCVEIDFAGRGWVPVSPGTVE